MAQKGGLKRFLLIVVFLVVVAVAFILLGGGQLLKQAGSWIGGVGNKAEAVKQDMDWFIACKF